MCGMAKQTGYRKFGEAKIARNAGEGMAEHMRGRLTDESLLTGGSEATFSEYHLVASACPLVACWTTKNSIGCRIPIPHALAAGVRGTPAFVIGDQFVRVSSMSIP